MSKIKVRAVYEPAGDMLAIDVTDDRGTITYTQAHAVEDVAPMAADAIATLWGIDPAEIEVEVLSA